MVAAVLFRVKIMNPLGIKSGANVPECSDSENDRYAGSEVENNEDKLDCARLFLQLGMLGHRATRHSRLKTDPIVCIHCSKNTARNHGEVIRACEIDKEQKADEVPVVKVPHTVVYPRTVVIWPSIRVS